MGRLIFPGIGKKYKLSRENILTDSIQNLKLVSVKVHAVALSKNTDEVLLKRIALETGGSFEIAETAQQLQKLFFKMFERATEPDSIRLGLINLSLIKESRK